MPLVRISLLFPALFLSGLSLHGGSFVAPLSVDVWYHVQVDLDFPTQTASGGITEFGGSTLSWSGHSFLQSLASLNTLLIDDAVSNAGKNGDLTLDNFSVRGPLPVTPVPEPSTYGLVASLLLSGTIWLRRFRAKSPASRSD